jgi:hypothetical protein
MVGGDVAPHARAKALGLADVQHLPLRVAPQVHARRFGEVRDLVEDRRGNGHHLRIIPGTPAGRSLAARHARGDGARLGYSEREGDEAGVAIILASPNEVMSEILAISRYDKLFTITYDGGLKR